MNLLLFRCNCVMKGPIPPTWHPIRPNVGPEPQRKPLHWNMSFSHCCCQPSWQLHIKSFHLNPPTPPTPSLAAVLYLRWGQGLTSDAWLWHLVWLCRKGSVTNVRGRKINTTTIVLVAACDRSIYVNTLENCCIYGSKTGQEIIKRKKEKKNKLSLSSAGWQQVCVCVCGFRHLLPWTHQAAVWPVKLSGTIVLFKQNQFLRLCSLRSQLRRRSITEVIQWQVHHLGIKQ